MDMDVDFLGEAWDGSRKFEGLGLDSKTGELNNLVFQGFDKEGNLVFEKDSSMETQKKKTQNWDDKQYLKDMRQDLLEFSRVNDLGGIITFAEKWGPLFGTRGYDGSKCVESLDMWWATIKLFNLGFYLLTEKTPGKKAPGDEEEQLYEKIEVEFKLTPEQKKQQDESAQLISLEEDQEIYLLLKLFFNDLPDDYWRFVLGNRRYEQGFWSEQRGAIEKESPSNRRHEQGFRREQGGESLPTIAMMIEEKLLQIKPSEELLRYDTTLKDLIESYEEAVPNLTVSFILNPRPAEYWIGKKPDKERYSLTEVNPRCAKGISDALCRSTIEALISMHTRNVQYSWLQHQFKPVFREHIRYLWFVFSIYQAQGKLAYCKHCGGPYWKKSSTRKYCSKECRKKANK